MSTTEQLQPLTLRGLSVELVELEALLNSAYDQTEPPADASDGDRAEYSASRESVEEAMWAYFVANEGHSQTKIDGYCGLIREFELRAKARKEEADRIAKLAESDANKVDTLKARLKEYLEFTKQPKVTTLHHSIWIQPNGGVKPLVLDEAVSADPRLLPAEYQKVKIEPDNAAIRKALETGDLPFAQLGERGNSLRLK